MMMAESFLFSIADSLIAKLASQLYEEASRVMGLYHHLQEFTNTLSLVKAVLLDAEQKQEHNHELREWLRQLKRVFSDAQDVLDEFECQTLQNQVVKAYGTTKTKVSRFFSSSNPLVFRYKMAQQIKNISNRLNKIAADRHKFGLQTIDVDTRVVHRREMTHSHVRDSDVIGREHDKRKIIHVLTQKNPIDIDKNIFVMPIVGMGGLGKTTLAKFVFNDDRIDECFPLKMWVCVSEDFDIKQMIVRIINSASHSQAPDFQQNLNILDMEQLQNQLRNKLGKKFLLVLDDVWNEDRVKWVELRTLIQVGAAAGSAVLVTTRSHCIATLMGTVSSHILQGISLEDSVSLFVKWAFKEGEEENYPHLIDIGIDIVKKCRGVPLAVRTIGSLLFSKFEANEWEYVRDSEIWNLPQKKEDILPTLKLSYDLMPSYLKQCFALFSLYPKDYKFVNLEVTTLWGALGLLRSLKKNMTHEDVANQYLYELQSRSFIQDFVSYGTAYTFQIHDLVHDLALFVSKDECLLVNSNIRSIPESIRHLSFVENDLDGKSISSKSGVKTIIFPKDGVGAKSEAFFTLVSRYKYLHILNLSHSSVETLPDFIGKLKHLRSLCLYNNKKIRGLPDSISELQSLQELDLGGCMELKALPKGLRKLISLQDFVITTKQAVLPENDIANLISLRYLTIQCCDNVESLFSVIELPYLKGLSLISCRRLESLPLDSKHFPAIETLCIGNCDKLELSKGHEGQEEFFLKLKTIQFLSLPQLQTLPHWLEGSIKTLLCLRLHRCRNLEVLPNWLPMLTCLKALDINGCPKLRSLPEGINCLAALERLEIVVCPELFRKFTLQVREHWDQMSHIKRISILESK